jgi:hypothetical protein
MLSYRGWGGGVFVGALVVGCGGPGFTAATGAEVDSGSSKDGSASEVDATTNDSAATADGGNGAEDASGEVSPASGDATASDGAQASDGGIVGADAPPPPCPYVGGAYAVTLVEAAGCADLNPAAPQCIRQDRQAGCGITFVSQGLATVGAAINGDPTLQNDGSFGDGSLKEGTVNRGGCTGTWDATRSTMTVDCGGTGSSQSCVVALKRTADICK